MIGNFVEKKKPGRYTNTKESNNLTKAFFKLQTQSVPVVQGTVNYITDVRLSQKTNKLSQLGTIPSCMLVYYLQRQRLIYWIRLCRQVWDHAGTACPGAVAGASFAFSCVGSHGTYLISGACSACLIMTNSTRLFFA